ncbi:uncharacterized protein [Triticum aestivum]|uniref:uncharacterized protein n=1 Tax=Triticum aestivum TaxID=4565 RepID=UPI001D030995|nr:uncharacterized protein LOC123076270 [Triticum aestivum]
MSATNLFSNLVDTREKIYLISAPFCSREDGRQDSSDTSHMSKGSSRCTRFGRWLVGFSRWTGLAGRASVGSRGGLGRWRVFRGVLEDLQLWRRRCGVRVRDPCRRLAQLRPVQRPQWRGGFVHDIQFWVVVLPSARVGDETPVAVSSCAVQSLRHSGPASANTTIHVGWKRRSTRAPALCILVMHPTTKSRTGLHPASVPKLNDEQENTTQQQKTATSDGWVFKKQTYSLVRALVKTDGRVPVCPGDKPSSPRPGTPRAQDQWQRARGCPEMTSGR